MVDWLSWLKRLEFTAVAALAIAGLCLVIGQSAERLADASGLTPERLADSGATGEPGVRSVNRLSVIDYATTGSIKGRAVAISPCKASD